MRKPKVQIIWKKSPSLLNFFSEFYVFHCLYLFYARTSLFIIIIEGMNRCAAVLSNVLAECVAVGRFPSSTTSRHNGGDAATAFEQASDWVEGKE